MQNVEWGNLSTVHHKCSVIQLYTQHEFFFEYFFSVGYVPRRAVNISPLASLNGSVAALGLDSAQSLSGQGQPCKTANRPGQIKIWTRTKELKSYKAKSSPNGGWIQASHRPNTGQRTIKHINVNNTIDITQLLYQFQRRWAPYWLFLILFILSSELSDSKVIKWYLVYFNS